MIDGTALAVRVLKFGGTCLSRREDRLRAVEHCLGELQDGCRLVVVVSAMGRRGDPYATDTLLELAGHPLPAEKTGILACGEIIAATVMADMLREAGVGAVAMSGWSAGLRTDGRNCGTAMESVDPACILPMFQRFDCVVIAGFQGLGTDGRVSTLGRGGSDVTAAALAAALDADELVLYKTVDSVYTADPGKVPAAQRIERISSEDLRQMAWQGAKVVHPSASEIAGDAGIRIDIRDHSSGDRVTSVLPFTLRKGKYITGVAAGPDVVRFQVGDEGQGPLHSFYSQVFGAVAGADVSMDMFSVLDRSVLFTVPVEEEGTVTVVLDALGLRSSTIGPCAKVSIVGAGMHGLKGVMARFAKALDAAGIDMLQTVDSHATISALVHLESRDVALRVLHMEFVEA